MRTRQTVTPELVRRLRPDALIVAVGAAHTKLDLPGARWRQGHPDARSCTACSRRPSRSSARHRSRGSHLWMPVGDSVVIMGGTLHGCELAEFLTKKGRQGRHRARRPGVRAG